jgi:hypothetical protein
MTSSWHSLIPFLPFPNALPSSLPTAVLYSCSFWTPGSNSLFSLAESESYITTDGQSDSLSWNKAPVWSLWPGFFLLSDSCVFVDVERSLPRGQVCRLQLPLALASAVILGSESLGTRDLILLYEIRDFPFRRRLRLEGPRWRYSIPPPHRTLNLPTYKQVLII